MTDDPYLHQLQIEHEYRDRGYYRPKTTAINWIPQQPTPRQKLFLDLDCKEAFYGGAAAGGKALSIYAIIPTVKGLKIMANIETGDEVFGVNGNPCKVLAISEVMHGNRVFDVVFDDGTIIRADAGHLWETYTYKDRCALHRRSPEYKERRRQTRPKRGTGKRPDLSARNSLQSERYQSDPVIPAIKTTLEIKDTLMAGRNRANHTIRMPEPLKFDEDPFLPIDPYLLGFWLGDGDCSGGRLTIGDQYLDDALSAIRSTGWAVRRQPKAKMAYRVINLTTTLRHNGLLDNKHIPERYFQSSIDQRKALLCGLMDTDGYACKDGQCEFYSSSDTLIRHASRLLSGLGIKHVIRVKVPPKNTHHRHSYRIKFTAPFPVFRLSEKLQRQNMVLGERQKYRFIVDVREVESEPVKCIAVDSPDKLYLAGEECVPTHNSSALLMAALQYVDVPSYAALILRRTYQDLAKPGALMDRAHSWGLRDKGAKWNEQKKQWTFPSGAIIQFGYLDTDADVYQFQSSEFQFCGFDELSQFSLFTYTYLFSRLRRLAGSDIPLRMRSASNPGGIGSDWVEQRFIPDGWTGDMSRDLRVWDLAEGRKFVPARIDDNPHVDQASYRESLAELDEVTREQLEEGNWSIRPKGNIYKAWSDGVNGHHVITWTQFASVFGVRRIPEHWKGACGQDWGFDPDPCATVWNWCAAENGPLMGSIFVNRILTCKGEIPDAIGEKIKLAERDDVETSRIEYRVMSHEASSQQETYRVKNDLSFQKWKPDAHGGIAQLQHYLKLRDEDKPHPFKPWLPGRPKYYVIVPDNQIENPRGDEGLALLRAEFAAYKYVEQKVTLGRGTNKIVPFDFFNHFMDAQRGIAARWFPDIARKTEAEKLEESLPAGLRADALSNRTGSDRDIAELMRQFKLDTIKRENKRQGSSWSEEVVSTSDQINWGSDDTDGW